MDRFASAKASLAQSHVAPAGASAGSVHQSGAPQNPTGQPPAAGSAGSQLGVPRRSSDLRSTASSVPLFELPQPRGREPPVSGAGTNRPPRGLPAIWRGRLAVRGSRSAYRMGCNDPGGPAAPPHHQHPLPHPTLGGLAQPGQPCPNPSSSIRTLPLQKSEMRPWSGRMERKD